MKKLFLTAMAVMLPMLIMAQALKPAIGINVTNVSKDPDTGEVQGQVAWQAGASFLIGNKFYVEPGVFYVKKSTKYVSSGTSPEEFKSDLTGVRIPVSVGLSLLGNEESLIGLRVFGGGSMFIVTSVDTPDLSKEDFNSPSWGVFAGAGVDIWILFVDLKYEWSLTDVTSVTDFNVGQYRSFYANAGVRIRF